MRLLIVLLLFAPGMSAIDMTEVDRDTLRYVRIALLKDDVRKHFDLKIGDFEALDQAIRVDVALGQAKEMVVLRLGNKCAGVLIETTKDGDRPGAHCFIAVESRVSAEARIQGEFVAIRCAVDTANDEASPVRTRLLRLHNDKLQCCLTWLSSEERSWDDGRYKRATTRKLVRAQGKLKLIEETSYSLDSEPVEGARASCETLLLDTNECLQLAERTESCIPISSHCGFARRLERDGLNEAALYHAMLAFERANAKQLADDDCQRLEAMSLIARLEARMRRTEVEVVER